jgi:DNA-directed RNA polymerase subunit alpha
MTRAGFERISQEQRRSALTTTTSEINVEQALLEGSLEFAEIAKLRKELYSNVKIREQVENLVKDLERKVAHGSDGQSILRLGVGQWLLGKYAEGAISLSKEASREVGAVYYALCLLDQKKPADALMALEHAVSKKPDSYELRILLIRAHREIGNINTAEKLLMELESDYQDRPDYHYEKACCLEGRGLYEEAMDEFEKAVTIDPEYAPAIFRLALAYDLRGSDEMAVKCYEQCRRLNPTFTNALINLGVLYEDGFDYKRAIKCYREVLEVEPDHPRAGLYLKDATASLNMYYDEDKAKQRDKRAQVLNTPVTDFELSVRSRNCLNKMHIRMLGDLVKKTEQELLSFKNFGETSLREIKEMLKQKGLRLGMAEELEGEFMPALAAAEAEAAEVDDAVLSRPIAQLELSTRPRRAMEVLSVQTIGDLVKLTAQDLLACKNFGQTSLEEIRSKLSELGLKLKGA